MFCVVFVLVFLCNLCLCNLFVCFNFIVYVVHVWCGQVLAPTYKSRCEEFKRLFKDIGDEKLVVDYSCALQKDILVHGRLYVSKNYVCFYANIFKWETQVHEPNFS